VASTLDRATERLAQAAGLLDGIGEDLDSAAQLLGLLGWDVPPGVADLQLAGADVSTVLQRLAELNQLRSEESPDELALATVFAELTLALADLLGRLESLPGDLGATPQYLAATRIEDEFFPRLTELLVIQLVGSSAPAALPAGLLLGWFELKPLPADPARFQVEHVRQIVHWDRIPRLFTDPSGLLRDVYGWGTAQADVNTLIANIALLLDHLAADTRVRALPRRVEEQITGQPAPAADSDPATQLFHSFAKGLGFDAFDVGVSAYALRPTTASGTDAGIGVSPYAIGTTETSFPISDATSLVLDTTIDLESGVALVLRGGRDPEVVSGLVRPASGETDGRLLLSLRNDAAADAPHVLLSLPGIRVAAASVTVGAGLAGETPLDPAVAASVAGGVLELAPDTDDGFLASIVPSSGVQVRFDLGISWSPRGGVRLTGGADLRATIPLHASIGPFRVDEVDLALEPDGDALALAATVVGAVVLGPFVATVAGVGTAAELRFERGNLGPVDLGFSFVPPTGVGLALDAPPISGGGFIAYDSQRRRYSGVLQLKLETVGITAIGVLDARLPDGGDGFALLVVLQASFPPVQIGLGFALTGVGGVVALNHRLDVDALRRGFAAGTIGRVLAPADPIRNATSLLADLRTVFPVARGVTVVGPTARLVWAGLVHFDLGIFIELPGPTRVVILGSAHASIDRPEGGAYLAIRVDVLGVVDVRARTAAFDAVLIDSTLLEVLDLTGGAAFRLSWGDQPYTVLTVGGFHPAYNPEPLIFPATLTRIAMVHGTPTDRLYLRFEGYFAVTTNTFQFGAAVQAVINAGSFNIQGILKFDTLIRFEPFHFQIDIRASVRVRYKSHNLAGLTFTGSLAGPGPVVLRGKVCIELLFFDICFSDTFTLGSADPPAVTPVGSAVDALAAELDRASNVRTGDAVDRYVAVRPAPPNLGLPLVSPLGQLAWVQRLAPLGLLLQRIGGAPLAAAETVDVSGPQLAAPELDWFAPGSFADLTDAEALNRRAFERLAGGARFGEPGTDDGPARQRAVTVNEIRLPARAGKTRTAVAFPAWLTSATQARLGADVSGPVTPVLTVREESWTLSDTSGAAVLTGLSHSQASQLAAFRPDAVATAAPDLVGSMGF
jgi:hypothetical protein